MKRLAICVCYDKQGIIDDYIPYLLNDLKQNLDKLVIVVNGNLTKEGKEKLLTLTSDVVQRENAGFDAGAWKFALTEYLGWQEIESYDELVLLNDTFFGPFYPFKEVFEKMDGRDVDFWGLTQHGEAVMFENRKKHFLPRHLQSYFLCIRKKMLCSQEFKNYWENQNTSKNWYDAVEHNEAHFTQYFSEKGFKWDSLISNEGKDKKFSYNPYGHNIYEILQQGFPVIKRKEFAVPLEKATEYNNSEDYRRGLEYIKSNTNYDTRLIFQNVLRNYNITDIHDALHLDYIIPDDEIEDKNLKIKDTCIVLHLYYTEKIERYISFVKNIPEEIDVIVTTTSDEKKEIIFNAFSQILGKKLLILVGQNRGRDIAGLLVTARPYLKKYKYLCFCHDKISSQTVYTIGNSFEHILWENTLKSKEYISNVISTLEKDDNLGFLSVPSPVSHFLNSFTTNFWCQDFQNTKKLLENLGISVPLNTRKTCLSIGTAFWCKTKALSPLFEYEWKNEDFLEEPLPFDGTISHAVERCFPFVAQSQEFYTGTAMTREWASVMVNFYKHFFFNYPYDLNDMIAERKGLKNCFKIFMKSLKLFFKKKFKIESEDK